MSHVLLLRAPSDSTNTSGTPNGRAAEDPYEKELAPATSVPVYETVQTLDELQWILETGPGFHGYKGVIVTSKRSVDAWAAAARKVPPPVDERAHWTDIPFYAVGSATGSSIRDLSNTLATHAPHLAPQQVLGAEEAGTGEQLAHFILARLAAQRETELLSPSDGAASASGSFSSASLTLTGSVSTDNLSLFASTNLSALGQEKSEKSPTSPTAPRRARALRRPTKFLFLVGDKTHDTLPTILSADDTVELDSVQVYATEPSPDFPNALRNAVLAQPKVKDWWIALFAPSGADYALPFLREHFTLPSLPSSSSPTLSSDSFSSKKRLKKGKGPPPARIAAIGPTTASHLRDVLKVEVAAVAAKPNAEALAATIRGAK